MLRTATHASTVRAILEAMQTTLATELDSLSLAEAIELTTGLIAFSHDANVMIDAAVVAVERRTVLLRAAHAHHTLLAASELVKSGELSLERIAEAAGIKLSRPAPAPAPVAVAPVAPVVVSAAAPKPAAPAVESASVKAAEAPSSAQVFALRRPYKSSIKYVDPATGQGWTGMGPKPKWFKAYMAAGMSITELEVAHSAQSDVKRAGDAPAADVAAAEASSDIGVAASFDASDFGVDDIDGTSVAAKVDGDIGEMLGELSGPSA